MILCVFFTVNLENRSEIKKLSDWRKLNVRLLLNLTEMLRYEGYFTDFPDFSLRNWIQHIQSQTFLEKIVYLAKKLLILLKHTVKIVFSKISKNRQIDLTLLGINFISNVIVRFFQIIILILILNCPVPNSVVINARCPIPHLFYLFLFLQIYVQFQNLIKKKTTQNVWYNIVYISLNLNYSTQYSKLLNIKWRSTITEYSYWTFDTRRYVSHRNDQSF